MKHKHKALKIIASISIILVILLGLALGTFYILMRPIWNFNAAGVPKITANPVEADKIFVVSQFRSGSGHDYSYNAWDGETCRSMKHYFNYSQNTVNNQPVRSRPGVGESN